MLREGNGLYKYFQKQWLHKHSLMKKIPHYEEV